LAVSATEWTPSASIDDEPVIAKPTNFASAIPAFADRAAMIAFEPPDADTATSWHRRD
jgi:hypothetical protein